MPISAEVIANSISPAGHQLTTFKLRYPKFIHGEFMTHRNISRNASSSRAIPVAKLIQEVEDDALRAGPVYWGREQKGMQSGGELEGVEKLYVVGHWREAALDAVDHAKAMAALGAHKSIVNRILEPFLHINVVATATEWDNFFGLRLHKDAQPEMRTLAFAMWEAKNASTPELLQPGQWYLPFVDHQDRGEVLAWARKQHGPMRDGEGGAEYHNRGVPFHLEAHERLIKVSVARCARISYESFKTGKRSTIEEDLKLYDRLVGAQPLHASPAEHQATPDDWVGDDPDHPTGWYFPDEHGNFIGWRQYRKMLPGEAVAPLPAEFS